MSNTSWTAQDGTFWEQAWHKARQDAPKLMDDYTTIAKEAGYRMSHTPFNEEIPAVLDNRVNAMRSKQWKFTIGKKTIKVREQVDKIIKMVQLIKDAGAAAAQADPIHLGLPWASVCLILPLLVNDSEQLSAVTDGLEHIANLIARYKVVEGYLCNSIPLDKSLETSIVHMYSVVLRYQASAACYLSRNSLARFLRSIPKLDGWASITKELKSAESQCSALLVDKNASDLQQALDTISKQLDQLLRQANADDRSYENKVVKIMEKVSSGSVENTHFTILKNLGSAYVDTAVAVEKWITKGENIAFFYCSRSNAPGNQTLSLQAARGLEGSLPEHILRSLLVQLCFRTSGASQQNPLVERYESDPVAFLDRQPTADECSEDLIDVIERNSLTHIVIDALDECSEPMILLRSLRNVASASSHLKISLTSRMHVPVQDEFDSAFVVSITEQNSKDIQHYVQCELRNPEKLRRSPLNTDEGLRDEVATVLISQTGSMFRWVEIQLAVIMSKKLVSSIRESLKRLRDNSHTADIDSLDKAYGELFELNTNSEQGMRCMAIRAFEWFMCSVVPLTPVALASFVATRLDGSLDQEITDTLVLYGTSNFLIVNESGFVQIAHVSALHFIEQTVDGPAVSLAVSRKHAAEACLAVIMSLPSPTWHELANSWEIIIGMRKQFGPDTIGRLFKVYAVTHGLLHLQQLTTSELRAGKLGELLDAFLGVKGLAEFDAWFEIWTRFAEQLSSLRWFHSLPLPDNLGIRTLKSSSTSSNQHLVATSLKLTSATISSIKSAQAKDSSKPIRRPQSLIGVETLHGPVLPRSRHSFEQSRKPWSSFEETPMRTSAECDTTAPNSPTAVGFPSIAINLFPPTSRSPSRPGEQLRSKSSDASPEAGETSSPGLIDWPFCRPSFARRISFGVQPLRDVKQGSTKGSGDDRRPSSSFFTWKENTALSGSSPSLSGTLKAVTAGGKGRGLSTVLPNPHFTHAG